MTPAKLLAKAEIAAASAGILLDAGDRDGACSRAYYAMFDAARGFLIAVEIPEMPRTHSGLIAAFGRYAVKAGHVSIALGKSLNRMHELRMIADYSEVPVELSLAKEAVREAVDFVQAIREAISANDRKFPEVL